MSFVLLALNARGERLVVPAEVAEMPEYTLAAGFLREYVGLLNSPKSDEISDKIRRTKEDGFRYVVGSDAQLARLTGAEEFAISFANDSYSASWSKGDATVAACEFPAKIGLLMFSNKIELEDSLISNLSAAQNNSLQRPLPQELTKNMEKVSCSNFYVMDRGYYITPLLSNRTVYLPTPDDDSRASLLIDTNHYKLESIANVMLSGYSPCPLDVTVKVSRYGYKSQKITLPFAALYDVLSANGSSPYWGVESFDGQVIKGLYVWTNPYGGYNHLLSVVVPVSALSEPTAIEASLHCFIRTDNLKSLFEEYR